MEYVTAAFEVLGKANVPSILVIAGIIFLFVAVIGKIGAYIDVHPGQQKLAGGIGLSLLLSGIVLFVGSAMTEVGKEDQAAPQENSAIASKPLEMETSSSSVEELSEMEPNDSFTRAQVVHLDQTIRGKLEAHDDEDLFYIDPERSGSRYSLRVSGQGWTHINIYNKQQDIVKTFSMFGGQRTFALQVSAPFYIGLTSPRPPTDYAFELKGEMS